MTLCQLPSGWAWPLGCVMLVGLGCIALELHALYAWARAALVHLVTARRP